MRIPLAVEILNSAQRMEDCPDPSHPDHFRTLPERLYPDATSLRHSQNEGPPPAWTRWSALLLPPHR